VKLLNWVVPQLRLRGAGIIPFLPGVGARGHWNVVSWRQKQNQEPLTLALSRRERGLTEVFGRSAPMCDTEPNARFKTNRNRLPLPRERGLTEVFGRSAPMCDTESNARFKTNRNRLPLPRERGLTEVFGRSAPMCDTESNARFKTNRNRLPLPRERAGVRGSHPTKPKPCARF
jgi:hypothetical protein